MQDLFTPYSDKVVGLGRRPDSVVGLDDVGPTVGLIDPPTFCAPITEDEVLRAHEALKGEHPELDPVFAWNPGRHKDAKNPTQCETARLYDLATDRWYREPPGSLLKNFGAGIVNAFVPGSDLGDAGSSTQVLGQLVGSFAGLFVNPLGAVGTAVSKLTTSMSLGSTLTNAINFAGKVFSGPLGSIASTAITSMFAAPKATPAVQTAVYSSPQPANIAEGRPLSYAQQQVFGTTPATLQASGGGYSVSTGSSKIPSWVWWIVGVVVAVIAGGFAFFSSRKRKR